MHVKRFLVLVSATVIFTGCYHATIDTGLAPSGQTVSKPWASSFIYGLVPPAVVETAAKCPNGAAKVDTQLTFLNQLVNVLTLGIYTPMSIEVQCAAPKTAMDDAAAVKVAKDGTAAAKSDAIAKAAQESLETAEPSYVIFE